ncbi:NmrA family transcriptional regulator [Saccharothrix sp. ALI-22-I]|uniref:NmrA family NAD(P)-binding protein n=1 Tax=Saccharothrix sp. ALI-22-I TaxID=1933778 RepID=UPI00097C70FD|nr:NmrA family NAD(P)-binding protein [Saccharothrix sp. ALI-22-I]ONI85147.1 NmrA family transcriptional regulator [Saccharothrix sp. ALI-22-I]
MILVTGVSGALGGLVLDRLNAVADLDVVAGTRAATAAARRIDFDDPTTLVDGFTDVRVLVFVSAGYAEDDVVLARHGAVVDAAATAGVRHVIYTSLAGSGDQLSIALAHRWTEARLAEAPFDVTVLRNGLYAEIPAGLATSSAESAAATGLFTAPLGHGRVAVVAREDLADITARVAVETQSDLAAGRRSRHAGCTYELAGTTAVGGEDIAGALAEVLGRPVTYQPVSLTQAREALAGLEPYQVSHTLSLFANIGAGLLESPGDDLAALLPTSPRPALDLISDALKAVVPVPTV